MSKQQRVAVYRDILAEEGFTPRLDSDGDVVFEYGQGTYVIIASDTDELFFHLVFPNFWSIDSKEEQIRVNRAVNLINDRFRVGKLNITRNRVSASIELLFDNSEHVRTFFPRFLPIIQEMTEQFRHEMQSGLFNPRPDQTTQRLPSRPDHSSSLVCSPDGRYIAVLTSDNRIMLAETANIAASRAYYPANNVQTLLFGNTSAVLAGTTGNNEVICWYTSNGMQTRTMSTHTRTIQAITFSADDSFLVSGGNDRSVCIWRVQTGELLHQHTSHTDWVRSVAVSPDNRYVYSAGDDKVIRCWELASGRNAWNISTHTDWIRSIATLAGGSLIVSSSDDKTVQIWRTADQTLAYTISDFTDWVRVLRASPGGTFVAAGDDDGFVRIIRWSDGAVVCTLSGHEGHINQIEWSSDGMFIIVRSTQGSARIWRVVDGVCLHHIAHSDKSTGVAFGSGRTAYSLNGSTVTIVGDISRSGGTYDQITI